MATDREIAMTDSRFMGGILLSVILHVKVDRLTVFVTLVVVAPELGSRAKGFGGVHGSSNSADASWTGDAARAAVRGDAR